MALRKIDIPSTLPFYVARVVDMRLCCPSHRSPAGFSVGLIDWAGKGVSLSP